jgi:hypothetical protein
MASANQIVQEEILPDMDEAKQVGLMAQLMLAKQATFDKPAKNRHVRPPYLRGYVNAKLTKMFVDGGAAINVMSYTKFRKLGMDLGDLTPTSIVLNDFARNPSDTKGVTIRVFGEENPTPCTLVIVPGSVAITYRTHYRIISFPDNEIRVQNIIFTSETTRYTNLVQAPWVKRQVEILRSGS